MRNSPHNFAFRIPHFAFLVLFSACTPVTTRPSFAPFPEALHAVINAPPADVTRAAQAFLTADTIRVHFASLRDAFLETEEFAGTHRLRVWADPDVPGKTRITIEAVYRPVEDPSRTRRDLERASPPGSPGQLRAVRLLAALKDKLGVTTY
ncbi:MAG TPA: hypothetical protein VGQ29_11220 [Gemmatimonadales bacterium]|nr:hypothetical protein [Gemmatimonadales bacterium]